MNVPVISSDVGGQAELITEDVGIIVPCLQKETEILDFNYSREEIQNYVDAIEKILDNLEYYKSNCRKRIIKSFTINKMINEMEKELESIALNPNKVKIQNGKNLSKNMSILKEFISIYYISNKSEYSWLAESFNKKEVHKKNVKHKKIRGPRNPLYEQTLEYKIKHPIVVILKKIGIYEMFRKVFLKRPVPN